MTNLMTFDNDATICVISEDAKGMLDPDSGHLENKEAKKIIPGGTQLLSKRPELFLPELWPSYYQKAKGIEVVTLDGIILKS